MSNPYNIVTLSKNYTAIEENGVRAFLVTGEKKALLVDTGFGTGDLKAVAEGLTTLPITLLNTHADGDHLGANDSFPCAMLHPAELERFREKGVKQDIVAVWDGDTVDLGGLSLHIIHIPGHTSGSIALLDRENRILIGGDSIQNGSIYMFGGGRNLESYLHSMKRMTSFLSEFDTVYPSHGDSKVPSDIIHTLIEGATLLLDGKLSGEPPQRELPCLLYKHKNVAFLY